jgi:tRNA 2-thiouridine synthesizing protein A
VARWEAFRQCPGCGYDFAAGEGERSCTWGDCPYLPEELDELRAVSVQLPNDGGEPALRRPADVRALGRTNVARPEHEAVAGKSDSRLHEHLMAISGRHGAFMAAAVSPVNPSTEEVGTMTLAIHDRIIDARGMPCPRSLMALIGAIREGVAGDAIEVLSTDESSKADIPAWVRKARHELVEIVPEDGYARFVVRKAGESS